MKNYRLLFALIAIIPALVLSCATVKQVGRAEDAKIILKNIDPAGSGRIEIYISRPGVVPDYIYLNPGEIKFFSTSSKAQLGITAQYGYIFKYRDKYNERDDSRWVYNRSCPPVYFDPSTVHTFTVRHNPSSYDNVKFDYHKSYYSATYPVYDVIIEEVIDPSVAQSKLRETSIAQGNLRDTAIQSTFQTISGILPSGSKIAVVNVSSRNSAESEYVIEELSVLLVNSLKYTVVDRRALDAIRQERNFQTSGEVDDDSVVSIGHFLGADIVLTGSISGEGEMRRLRFRALDVKTAQVLAMSSERL
jgi:hypothetical protein